MGPPLKRGINTGSQWHGNRDRNKRQTLDSSVNQKNTDEIRRVDGGKTFLVRIFVGISK